MADTPRFSPEPDPLPMAARRATALDANVADKLGNVDVDRAKQLLATVHGLTLAGEGTKAIAELTKLTPGQVLFAQRVLRARGELADQAQAAVDQFRTEGIILAIEGAVDKLKAGDGRFIERTLEEGGVWSKKGVGTDEGAARGAVNPGLPALTLNINLPPGVDPAEKRVFGQVLGTPKDANGADAPVQRTEQS